MNLHTIYLKTKAAEICFICRTTMFLCVRYLKQRHGQSGQSVQRKREVEEEREIICGEQMKEKQQCCFVSNAALWSSVSMFALMVSVRTCVNSPVPEERCIFLYVPAMACCMHPWDLKYPFLLHPHQRDNSTINNR